MIEVEQILKKAVFTDPEHKQRLYSELFDNNIISYNKHRNGGTKMAEDKRIFDAKLDNELTDDDLDNAAAGMFVGPAVFTKSTERVVYDAVDRRPKNSKAKADNAIFISGGKTPGIDPNGPTMC